MIKISSYDPHLVADIVKFRRDTYTNSGRDPNHVEHWSADEFDEKATHVVMFDEDGKIIDFVVKKGDKVLISKYGGTEIKVDDTTYLIMREDDILGILG